MAFPAGWGRKQSITIQSSQVVGSGSHTDFPVLITLDHLNAEIVDAGINSALNGGGDIRFSADSDGLTQLACEVVEFVTSATAGSRRCQIWVKMPSLSTSSNTTIYIWCKKTGESQPATTNTYGARNVWDSNYILVAHNCAVNSVDDTGLALTGSSVTGVTDYFGGNTAVNFLDHEDEIYYSYATSNYTDWTMSWMAVMEGSTTDSDGWGFMYTDGNDPPTEVCGLANRDDGRWNYYSTPEDWASGDDPGAATVGVWTTQTIKITNSNGILYNMRDGVTYNSEEGWDQDGSKDTLLIGHDGDSGSNDAWEGAICNVRFSNIERSNEWVYTEQNNAMNPSSFATAGTPEASEAAISINTSGHTHAADALTIEVIITLMVQDSSHVTISDNVVIDVAGPLEVSYAINGHLADGLIIGQVHTLSLGDNIHTLASDNILVAVDTFLTINAAGLDFHSDNLDLTEGGVPEITVQSSVHALLSNGLSLGYNVDLVISGATHDVFADQVLMMQNHVLLSADIDHAHLAEAPTIVTPVTASNASHGLSDDFSQLSQIHNLSIDQVVHAITADSPDIRVPVGVWRPIHEETPNWTERPEVTSIWTIK